MRGREGAEMGNPPPWLSRRNLRPFPTTEKKERERSKQTNLGFFPSILKYNEI